MEATTPSQPADTVEEEFNEDAEHEGGFSKTTNFKWAAVGLVAFLVVAFLPVPHSLTDVVAEKNYGDKAAIKAAVEVLFPGVSADQIHLVTREVVAYTILQDVKPEQLEELTNAENKEIQSKIKVDGANRDRVKEAIPLRESVTPAMAGDAKLAGDEARESITYDKLRPDQQDRVNSKARQAQIIVAMLVLAVILFATEAVPLPAVALIIAGVQLFSGIAVENDLVKTFAHDAVFFIAGALAIAVVFVEHGLDKRLGMVVIRFAGTSTRRIVLGILIATAFTTPFISEHAIAAMFLPIGVAIYSVTSRVMKCPNLGKLLMFVIAFGCNIGGPGAPSAGARNAIMVGFLDDYFGIKVGYGEWMTMGMLYPLIMVPVLFILLPMIFKPETNDLSEAVDKLKDDLAKEGRMTAKQWLVVGIFVMVVFAWIADENLMEPLFGHMLGLGGIAVMGALAYLLLGLISWSKMEKGIPWGVVLLYAGAISFGSALETTGAAQWLAQSALSLAQPLGMNSGTPLAFLAGTTAGLLTNLMSDGATVSVLGPIVLAAAKLAHTNPLIVGLGTSFASAFAYFLVIGTPPNAIVYSSGLISSKDFLKAGLPIWIASIIVYGFVIWFIWGLILGIPSSG